MCTCGALPSMLTRMGRAHWHARRGGRRGERRAERLHAQAGPAWAASALAAERPGDHGHWDGPMRSRSGLAEVLRPGWQPLTLPPGTACAHGYFL